VGEAQALIPLGAAWTADLTAPSSAEAQRVALSDSWREIWASQKNIPKTYRALICCASMTVDEWLALLQQGFSEVVYYEVECKRHGAYRVAQSVDLNLGDRSPCPRCGQLSPCGYLGAFGLTKRSVPWSEQVSGTAAGLNHEGWDDPILRRKKPDGRNADAARRAWATRRLELPTPVTPRRRYVTTTTLPWRERRIIQQVAVLERLDKLRRGGIMN